MMKNKILVPILIVISLAVGFVGGSYFQIHKIPVPIVGDIINKGLGQPQNVDFATFWTAWNLLQDKYVDKGKLNTQDMVYGAIDGMVKAIGDPYTVFFKPKESKEFGEQISGSFSGIGMEIGLRNNILTVIAPIKNTPAAYAGLLAGDKILKVNDKSTDGMTVDEAVSLIRGPKGTTVRLTYTREKMLNPTEITIKREVIKVPAVDWKMLNDNTAYVEISIFNGNLDSEFQKIADEVVASKASRIILDLRNDPGGLLDSAINIAGYFLDSSKTVTIEKFSDGTEQPFQTAANGKLKNYPLVILINKGSASASEILTGALRDNRGVTVVGETSFGKGSVQELAELPQKASLKITIAKWLTPSGTSIDENGIKPDIEVQMTEEDIKAGKDPQLDKAKELIKNL
jgi:carboxyl-terminal processing protease